MDYRRFKSRRVWLHLISLPIIWLPLLAVILLDILGEIYHQICFPIYGLEKVKRSEYIQIVDRNKLQYLNFSEKLGCMYCGYVNGYLLYLKEIAGRTEKYWCGIMHQKKPGFRIQVSQVENNFSPYGDQAEFEAKYPLK
ncbi:MAG: hypothetical protein WC564_04000 [Patescibacteria group bacterium]